MHWLGLDHDEGPFYQMQRMDRYREVIAKMLAAGTAYPATARRRSSMRCAKRRAPPAKSRATTAAGGPSRARCCRRRRRRRAGGALPEPGRRRRGLGRQGQGPDRDQQRRTRRPGDRAAPDGTPTYNFCVVVDDMDMAITHVIRGDDHVNNTPRQINILRALGAELPEYAHVPMILGPDGDKLSKRHGAVSVMQYDDEGYLPDAMVNYLARLGWSHGDDEMFSREQLVAWFDGQHLARSPAQWDAAKLELGQRPCHQGHIRRGRRAT